MKQVNHIFFLLVLTVIFSCETYLSKLPSPSSDTPIHDVSQLKAIYDNAPLFIQEPNNFAWISNDDGELSRELYLSQPRAFSNIYTNYNSFFIEGIASAAYDPLWTQEFYNIVNANVIINNIDNVNGEKTEKLKVKCNAHFLRAYSYFVLVQYYCLPYCEKNKNALGLPKRLKSNFEESLKRVSLEEIYALILSDLEIAMNTPEEEVDPTCPWRIGKTTVNALLARIYLTMGKYEDAYKFAETALKKAPELLDYNELGYAPEVTVPAFGNIPKTTLRFCETYQWRAIKFMYWKEFIFPRVVYSVNQWFIPSEALLGLYDRENDRRFELFFVEYYSRRRKIPQDAYAYSVFDDGRYIISGLTTAELLLIKAETQVRLGKWQEGLKTLDLLRVKRYKKGSYMPLAIESPQKALAVVLDERRRELPFAMRIPDIKRYAVNETQEDDVTVVKHFFELSLSKVQTDRPKTYTIKPDSPLWAFPINKVEIGSSGGEIEQNPY